MIHFIQFFFSVALLYKYWYLPKANARERLVWDSCLLKEK